MVFVTKRLVSGSLTISFSLRVFISWFSSALFFQMGAEKCKRFKTLPTILQFNLKRFSYDTLTNESCKISDKLVPQVLDMKTYMLPEKDIEEEVPERTPEKPSPPKKRRVERNVEDPNWTARKIKEEGSQLYELVGVVVHMGTTKEGHYFSLGKEIREGTQNKG